jgi:hypothetical protein
MKYRELRSLVQFHLQDLDSRRVDPALIDTFINEGLRKLAFETLLLEGKDSSLTYSSGDDGFTLPTDFIKVKDLVWLDPSQGNHSISQISIAHLRKKRNDWLNLNESSGTYLQPLGYAIHNGTIILDSTTQVSPTLYYYKYDTALSAASDTPSIDSEFHSSIADYALYKITNNFEGLSRWREQVRQMNASKFKQGKSIRTRFYGL